MFVNQLKKPLIKTLVPALLLSVASMQASAADYVIDTKGQHAFIQFKIQHLGYSWLLGNFNTFEGKFSYDANDVNATKVALTIDTNSVDSNHAERDKHLRGKKFLDVKAFPQAKFVSTKVVSEGGQKSVLHGDLTLHGVTKNVAIQVNEIGGGKDPWGGYRQGFEGKTTFALADFGIMTNLGPASQNVEMYLSIEGVRL
jgi:polyisoprenoid-binding protein YceI